MSSAVGAPLRSCSNDEFDNGGETRFLSSDTPRNAQPAAVAADAINFLDALRIQKVLVAGFDWGGRTANLMAFLWPERCKALVSVSGYLVGSQTAVANPLPPNAEFPWWYLFYFSTERRKAGYAKYTNDLTRLIWQLASPRWAFDDATFDRTTKAFENPDFVHIPLHNYRWCMRLEQGARTNLTSFSRIGGLIHPTLAGEANLRLRYFHRPYRRDCAQWRGCRAPSKSSPQASYQTDRRNYSGNSAGTRDALNHTKPIAKPI